MPRISGAFRASAVARRRGRCGAVSGAYSHIVVADTRHMVPTHHGREYSRTTVRHLETRFPAYVRVARNGRPRVSDETLDWDITLKAVIELRIDSLFT